MSRTSDQPETSDATTPDAETTDSEALDADVAGLGYEEARDELSAIVARLESGQVGLEESMRLWERGEALAAHCEAWLDKAEASLQAGDDAAEDPED